MAEKEYDHPDATQDLEQIRPILEGMIQAFNTLAARVEHLEGSHGALSKLVTDDLIGGIHGLYQAKMRDDRIEGLRTKYGEMLGPHFEKLEKLSHGDHWGALHDMTKGMEGDELDNHIKGLAEGLGKKFESLNEKMPPEGGAVEVTKVEKKPMEEGMEEKPKEEVKREGEESEPPKKSKDEKITEALKDSKRFKLR